MLVYAIAIAMALVIPLVTRGSYTRLFSVHWHWAGLLFAGLAIQIVLEYVTIPAGALARLRLRSPRRVLRVDPRVRVSATSCCAGMGIVIIGIACNALVIALNQGMPVKIPADVAEQDLDRRPR